MTKDCDTALPRDDECGLVYSFKDGELGAVEAQRFRLHVAGCEHCAQRLGDAWYLEELMARAGEQSEFNASPRLFALEAQCQRELETRPVPQFARAQQLLFPRWRVAASGMVLVLVTISLVW